jgi:hypothetical protein
MRKVSSDIDIENNDFIFVLCTHNKLYYRCNVVDCMHYFLDNKSLLNFMGFISDELIKVYNKDMEKIYNENLKLLFI